MPFDQDQGRPYTIPEFLRQLGDGELTRLEDMIHQEYHRRAENMVNGVGEAARHPIHLAAALVSDTSSEETIQMLLEKLAEHGIALF